MCEKGDVGEQSLLKKEKCWERSFLCEVVGNALISTSVNFGSRFSLCVSLSLPPTVED